LRNKLFFFADYQGGRQETPPTDSFVTLVPGLDGPRTRRTADMPLYTLRRIATGETIQTTDPVGRW
jgi:hypothetical protein